jgi:hypothetical protein
MWESWETWGQFYWPQPWPYPDQALQRYHDWLDARNPDFKLHGEYENVHRHINRIVFPLVAIASLAFGLATPELGRLAWHRLRRLFSGTFKRKGLNRMHDAAKRLLELRASEAVQARMEELAKKSNEGTLSKEERDEYETLVSAGTMLAILQSRARKLLRDGDASP